MVRKHAEYNLASNILQSNISHSYLITCKIYPDDFFLNYFIIKYWLGICKQDQEWLWCQSN